MSSRDAHPGHQSTSSSRIVVPRDEIAARVAEPGDEITARYAPRELTVVGAPAAPAEERR